MAVTFKQAGRIGTKTFNIPFVGDRVTMSAYVRVNSLPTGSGQTLFLRGQCRITATGTAGASTYSLNTQGMSSGNVIRADYRTPAAVGAVYHVLLAYDKDDVARRFAAVNGAKIPWGEDFSGPLANLGWLGYGSTGQVLDYTIQRAFFLDGYAATDADLFALATDVDAAPTVFAAAAALPGVLGMYHSLEGTVGADVHMDEPGVSWGGNPNYGIPEPTRAGAGDEVRYSEAMACHGALAVGRAYVGSSGKTVTIIMTDGEGRGRITPQSPTMAGAPSIRIDGGAPVALPTTAATGAYVQPTADALFFRMPDGVSAAAGQEVLLDAPAGWLAPQIGFASALSGVVVDNFAGMPISDGLWPGAAPIRVGTNAAIMAATEYTPVVVNRNRALSFRAGMNAQHWPDGTYKGPISGVLLMTSGLSNGIDPQGIGGKEGLWAIGWGDFDPANPVTMSLSGSGASTAVEVGGYRNYGDASGQGKVRVYDVRFGAPANYTLASTIDAATTAIPCVEAVPAMYADGYLTIDDEQILLGTLNVAARRFEGCTRAWNGTAAVSHAAGATVAARRRAKNGSITVTMTCPDAPNLHYRDFVCYEPGSWTPPGSLVPATLPMDDMALDPAMLSYLEPGIGAFRHMDTTPAQGYDVSEPEQLAKPGRPHDAYRGLADKFHFASVRPFDPAEAPYFYTSVPWPSSETYPATLGAAIATAPASGTRETITITDGRATPVMLGQFLFVGGETMRVVGVPRTGDAYEVERGSINTPTATHAAGPISVGYRVPVVEPGQYIPVEPKVHRYEAFFDQDLSTPLTFGRNLGHGGYSDWAGSADANIASRRTLTLTAPLSAAGLDVYATPASPSDWDFIAKNIDLVIGAEVLSVASVDSGAGRITVRSRPAGAIAYAAGTTATTRSSGILLRSPDGTKRGYNRLYNPKQTLLPTAIDRALVFVGDDLALDMGVGGYPPVAQAFDAPNAGTKEFVTPYGSFSYAFTARQTATAPRAWHWLCVPPRGGDATVYEVVKQVRDNFPPGRKVVFELGNELWNWFFPNTQVYNLLAPALRVGNHLDLYILRSRSAYEVARACFAEVGREDELIHVLCLQTQEDILPACRRLGVEPDAVAVAPYLYPPETAAYGSVFNATDDDQACDLYTYWTYYEQGAGQFRKIAAAIRKSVDTHEAITGRRPLAWCYEGGLESVVTHGTPGYSDPMEKRCRDVVYNPNFYFTERDFYAAMRELAGVSLYVQYEIASTAVYKPGDPIHYWGMLRGPAQKAGYGDGRPGSADNRRYRYAAPEDLTRTGDVYCDSVRMQAWLDHQKRWMAAQDAASAPLVLMGSGGFQEFD